MTNFIQLFGEDVITYACTKPSTGLANLRFAKKTKKGMPQGVQWKMHIKILKINFRQRRNGYSVVYGTAYFPTCPIKKQ